jgi:hypothetical protein
VVKDYQSFSHLVANNAGVNLWYQASAAAGPPERLNKLKVEKSYEGVMVCIYSQERTIIMMMAINNHPVNSYYPTEYGKEEANSSNPLNLLLNAIQPDRRAFKALGIRRQGLWLHMECIRRVQRPPNNQISEIKPF